MKRMTWFWKMVLLSGLISCQGPIDDETDSHSPKFSGSSEDATLAGSGEKPPTFCGQFGEMKDRFTSMKDEFMCDELQDDYIANSNQWIGSRGVDMCCECYFPGTICPSGHKLIERSRCAMLNEDYRRRFDDAIENGVSAMYCPKPNAKDIYNCCEQKLSLTDIFAECKAKVTAALPELSSTQTEAFMAAYRAEATNGFSPYKNTHETGYQRDNEPLRATTLSVARPILESESMTKLLSSDALDHELMRCALLAEALPAGLEEFYNRGAEEKKMIDDLLANNEFMKTIMVAGGAKAGKYGNALQVLKSIMESSERASEGIFKKLAIATSLEFAAPDAVTSYDTIDPVKRYKLYEDSYVNGKLVPQFSEYSIFLYRQIVNDWTNEEDLAWLQDMVNNYRPDIISRFVNGDENTFYLPVRNSKGNGYNEYYPPIPQAGVIIDESLPYSRIQQIFFHGGQCGAKAEIGRAVARSLGVPAFGFRLRSHADPGVLTPSGWDGATANFQDGYWEHDVQWIHTRSFWIDATARQAPEKYMRALRLKWISAVLGEEPVDLMWAGRGDLWAALARNQKRAIVKDGGLAPWSIAKLPRRGITEDDKTVTTDSNGVITVPAVACYKTTYPSRPCVGDHLYFLETHDEPSQLLLHAAWPAGWEKMAYKIHVSKAGTYRLTADIVTVTMDQFLALEVNGVKSPVPLRLPYTVGEWMTSAPIEVTLNQGENTVIFTRFLDAEVDPSTAGLCNLGTSQYYCSGITVKHFTLTPVE